MGGDDVGEYSAENASAALMSLSATFASRCGVMVLPSPSAGDAPSRPRASSVAPLRTGDMTADADGGSAY
jgi:hypothetical protein